MGFLVTYVPYGVPTLPSSGDAADLVLGEISAEKRVADDVDYLQRILCVDFSNPY